MKQALQILRCAWNDFEAIAPRLVASFVPSLIVGLTPYPKTAGVVRALKLILNFLSALTHHDSPGTFKHHSP
jgi:hypothetical protein